MKAKEVLNHLKITRTTLSKYVKIKKIRVIKLDNSYYNYNEEDVFNLKTHNTKRKNVIYARVSTSNQKKDLENQLNTLREFSNRNGFLITDEISDISSGMNLDKKYFNNLINDVFYHKIDKVIITNCNRLTRLHFKFIENLFYQFGTEIIVLNDKDSVKGVEQEFFEELASMTQNFSMKMRSKRRKQKLELVSKDLQLESEIPDSNI